MLDIKRLRLLWELQARGTVGAVAEALNYSPSAVSQQLATLEREAGAKLLQKEGRNLTFTAAGRALVSEAENLLAGLERTEALLLRYKDVLEGTVRLSVFQTALLSLMPLTLQRLRIEQPGIRVLMVQHEPETALHETWARKFDLVVAEQYPGHAPAHFPGLDREFLTSDPIKLALPLAEASHPEFQAVQQISDAKHLPWVMEPVGAASRHWAEHACRTAGFEPDVRYETADLQAHIRLIESGNAVAFLPGLVHVKNSVSVRSIDLPGAPKRTIFTSMRNSSTDNTLLQEVRKVLLEVATQIVR